MSLVARAMLQRDMHSARLRDGERARYEASAESARRERRAENEAVLQRDARRQVKCWRRRVGNNAARAEERALLMR